MKGGRARGVAPPSDAASGEWLNGPIKDHGVACRSFRPHRPPGNSYNRPSGVTQPTSDILSTPSPGLVLASTHHPHPHTLPRGVSSDLSSHSPRCRRHQTACPSSCFHSFCRMESRISKTTDFLWNSLVSLFSPRRVNDARRNSSPLVNLLAVKLPT